MKQWGSEIDWLESIADLKKSYRGTLRGLAAKRRLLLAELQELTSIPIDELAAKRHRGERMRLKADNSGLFADLAIMDEIISDLNFAINWMHTGKRPGNKRGIERRSAYQREKLMDPIRMQAYVQRHTAGSAGNISEWQRAQISDALSVLSPRERECYELHFGMCYTYEQIATMLCVQKGTVQYYVKTANKKINHAKITSLFLME